MVLSLTLSNVEQITRPNSRLPSCGTRLVDPAFYCKRLLYNELTTPKGDPTRSVRITHQNETTPEQWMSSTVPLASFFENAERGVA